MKVKKNIRFLTIVLFIIIASTFFTSCKSQNLSKGVVEFGKQKYSNTGKFQINSSYFDGNGKLKKDYSTHITNINGGKVYSIKGLDVRDWIYFDYADCDAGFYLSKNIATKLNNKYFDFSDKFKLIRDDYSIKNGFKRIIDTNIVNKNIVAYAFKNATSNGNSDMGVTSDEITTYSLLLTPKAFSALQYIISYYEYKNGYFIGSNTNAMNTKVDNSIHEIITKLK